ncbi:MAG: phosphate signaling complex protein PhoU [Christensenellales bacterium]|jgi:phosphate transport system protein
MTRNAFEQSLKKLHDDLVTMGNMAEEAIDKAICALINQDKEMAEEVAHLEKTVDAMEKSIESHCLKLLLQQQPVARDLRAISTALKMITDIERICDQAEDIVEISMRMFGQTYIKEPKHIMEMAGVARDMLTKSIDAYICQDVELAKKVIEMDDVVDNLFNTIKEELSDLMIKDRTNLDQVIDFLMIAKYLERIGDHAENIADWVIFSVTGVHKDERIM